MTRPATAAEQADHKRDLLKHEPRASDFPYIYRWDRQGRKGEPCKVTARGTMNSCLVVFADRFAMVTSRNAIRKAKPLSPSAYGQPSRLAYPSP